MNSPTACSPDLSVVVPLFNEQDNVASLVDRLGQILEEMDLTAEVLLVDDGSRDATFPRAASAALADRRFRVVKLRRNYGQTPAMVAGMRQARGRIILTMDGDLQNDPQDIPLFLAKIEEGYDIVVGWRQNRQDKLVTRKVPSRVANWLIGKVTGVPIRDNGCSLKAYRAEVIKSTPLYSEMHRFIPAMSSIAGARVAEIPVRHHARQHGVSKYGLSRIYKVALDLVLVKTLLVSVASPLKVFGAVGGGLCLVGTVMLLGSLLALIGGEAGNWLMLAGTSGLLVAGGGFVVSLGLLASLLFHTGDMRRVRLARLTLRTDKRPINLSAVEDA